MQSTDADGSAKLTLLEFLNLAHKIGLPREQAEVLFYKVDADSSGEIDW